MSEEWIGYVAGPVGVLAGTFLGWALTRKDEKRRRGWSIEDRNHAKDAAIEQRLWEARAKLYSQIAGTQQALINAALIRSVGDRQTAVIARSAEFDSFVHEAYLVAPPEVSLPLAVMREEIFAHILDLIDGKPPNLDRLNAARALFLKAAKDDIEPSPVSVEVGATTPAP